MDARILPFLPLMLAVLTAYRAQVRLSVAFAATAVALAIGQGQLEATGMIAVSALGALAWIARTENAASRWRWAAFALFVGLSLTTSNHLVPGFQNLKIYDHARFSSDSVPFTMYLNFDKTLAGLIAYVFLVKPEQASAFHRAHLATSAKALALLMGLLLPVACLIHYVRVDVKFPDLGWIWLLNNLFFVCMAEEVLFRGLIQGTLQKALPTTRLFSALSILMASGLFGLAHYKGGLPYIALATFAGLFYGFVYWKTRRIESSIAVHFGLNLTHFLFFSYPALAAN